MLLPGRRALLYGGLAITASLLALAVALWIGGGGPPPPIKGLPTPGPLTVWGLSVTRLFLDLCSIATVGTLVAGVVLAPRDTPEANACVRAAGWWALGWAACALITYLLTLSNILSMPANEVLRDFTLLNFGTTLPQTQAMLIVTCTATVVVLASSRMKEEAGLPRWTGVALLVTAGFGMLPPVYVGHAASAGDHDIAVSALTTHLLAAAVWVGGLAAVLVHFRRSDRLASVVARFSTLALCCFVAVTVSGVAGAWVRMDTVPQLWTTRYGVLVLGKVTALVALGVFGMIHRRRTIAAIAERTTRGTFTRLATGELMVMAAATGLAAGLSRSAPPASGGHNDLLGYDLAPYSIGALLTEIRLNPLVLLALALPAAAYLAGVRRLARTGDPWPVGRTLAWFAGLAVLAAVLVGGVSGYARAMPSAHALQYTVLHVIGPLLLAFGAPLTLTARAITPGSQYGDLASALLRGRLAARLTHPMAALAVYVLPVVILYGTGWLAWSAANQAVHLLTQVLFFGTGLLCCWLLAGVDPLPRPIARRDRAWLLGAVVAVQVVVGLFLLAGPVLGQEWFAQVAPRGVPSVAAEQRMAGLVYLALPVPALAALAVRLIRSRKTALRLVARVDVRV
ncbi:cytochrome c oxidase assembly protein [Nonomuraea guangzhouensis]|uniref:Cytochrome c oxidase assembly protein n=1 Tax=Nonomuraea guangzhouensis TaxID=1291555 RepID=A0ABW4G6V1_9ACTN|nr:cytochrome c oxidase assembly protein [Nonomuraea guangzhouensis]